ncbi:MAG TPA: choice-of-anchor Q domain-containing protein, partial [Phnomibacter sp.]|nr:choice-of-anchor Q domain-containing protein [Phnomibacter sp.]
THILNAYQAIVAQGDPDAIPAKLVMEQCVVHNAYDIGILAINSSIAATNCRITQCGNDGITGNGGSNIILSGGGNYHFEHNTIATFANFFQNHRQPVLVIGNSRGGNTNPLSATFANSIIYGEGGLPENEIVVFRTAGPAFSVLMQNVLYRAKDALQNVTFQDAILNEPPQFDSINTSLRSYNFRLRDTSPAVDAGRATTLPTDLDGNPRSVGTRPDLGCYERQ